MHAFLGSVQLAVSPGTETFNTSYKNYTAGLPSLQNQPPQCSHDYHNNTDRLSGAWPLFKFLSNLSSQRGHDRLNSVILKFAPEHFVSCRNNLCVQVEASYCSAFLPCSSLLTTILTSDLMFPWMYCSMQSVISSLFIQKYIIRENIFDPTHLLT